MIERNQKQCFEGDTLIHFNLIMNRTLYHSPTLMQKESYRKTMKNGCQSESELESRSTYHRKLKGRLILS